MYGTVVAGMVWSYGLWVAIYLVYGLFRDAAEVWEEMSCLSGIPTCVWTHVYLLQVKGGRNI